MRTKSDAMLTIAGREPQIIKVEAVDNVSGSREAESGLSGNANSALRFAVVFSR